MKNLLSDVRVLDLTNVLSGPFCTSHLALCGAEVIKIENPKDGDLARKLGCEPKLNKRLMGTSFLAQNVNKKSVTLNLKHEKGKEIFRKLVETADVVVENFRPGVMARLCLSYKDLIEIKPDLIYCAISGFGQTGPDSCKPAYDQIIQGLSGVMDINGDEDQNPLRCGFPVCDTVGGLNAAFAIMGALFYRERTGEGQFIDVALLDSIMPMLGWVAANLLIGKQQPSHLGNHNFTSAPSGTFKTGDGYINIAANKQEQWEKVTDVLGIPELKNDPRFSDRETRKQNRSELTLVLEKYLVKKKSQEWIEELNKNGVPSGAILKLEDALSTSQLKHRNTLTKIEDKEIDDLYLFNLTAKYEKTPGYAKTPPPRLSEHTAEILHEIGISKEEINKLKQEGIL